MVRGVNPPTPLYLFSMKYIITENQMERAVIKYLNSVYSDLKEFRTKEYSDLFFFMKNGEVIFEYNPNYKSIGVSEYLWEFLDSFFELESNTKQWILYDWLKEHYDLPIKRVSPLHHSNFKEVEEMYSLTR
jgi:hypothetical protein